MTLKTLDSVAGAHPCKYGLLLYQYGAKSPVAVVSVMLGPWDKIKSIILSRKKSLFKLSFFEEDLDDSPDDLPGTVTPLTTNDRHVKELQDVFSGQHIENKPEDNGSLYIWRKADEYLKDWLKARGYAVLETQVFEDCIGYRCNRNNYAYTIYMYAYGQKKTVQLDGDCCAKLRSHELSVNSNTLIVCLNVKRFMQGGEMQYRVCNYCGDDNNEPELWQLSEVNGKPILQYFPRKEILDLIPKLMYAFNLDSMDVYDCNTLDFAGGKIVCQGACSPFGYPAIFSLVVPHF